MNDERRHKPAVEKPEWDRIFDELGEEIDVKINAKKKSDAADPRDWTGKDHGKRI